MVKKHIRIIIQQPVTGHVVLVGEGQHVASIHDVDIPGIDLL